MKMGQQLRKVALLGDYPPRQCGIATFTSDLRTALGHHDPEMQFPVVAVNDKFQGYSYAPEVRFEINAPDIENYQRAADFLNLADVDILCVQHEFGIYGGQAGSHLLALLRKVRMPVVTTLHTILRDPDDEQRKVFCEILGLSGRVVVMSETGACFLDEIYGATDKVDIIPHGIPDSPFVDPNFYKDNFGVEGRPVLLTFGLLSPNKGIEHVIEALPRICEKFPDVVYIVLGATHPNIIREQGETYRLSLERIAKSRGVARNVIFHNRYVSVAELKEFIGAADIYITPYMNEAQITSGTLAYCFGMGKAVVSTPYWHAKDLLSCERGRLVPFGSSEEIADNVIDLLSDEIKRHAMRKNAYRMGREMIWSNVAHLYISSFEHARRGYTSSRRPNTALGLDYGKQANLPPWRFDHLVNMTDTIGMFQHATFTIPDFSHGYCTDDNARALILMVLLKELGEEFEQMPRLMSSYASFIGNAFNNDNGRFVNFMSFSREWLEEKGSEDSHARAIWALGTCVGRSKDRAMRAWAARLLELALPAVGRFRSPRAMAMAVIGLHEYLRTLSGDRLANTLRESLSMKLLKMLTENSRDDWFWIEDIVSYDNAKIPHALISTGRWTSNSEMLEAGLKSLRWLVSNQTAPTGHFAPIGSSGFWERGSEPARFDQQPVEAQATINACAEAYGNTGDEFWLLEARKAFDWFLGCNELGLSLYDASTGGCHDGLHIDRVNQNEGAESTLSFLLSLAEMHALRSAVISFESEKE
ncbi:MAG: glycosyltransferase family 4 protein [Victivallales bacterium]|nr:glycosyltransferase family 4 protein [Victivallales bacterium]